MTPVSIKCEKVDDYFDLWDYGTKANTEAIIQGLRGVDIQFGQVCQGGCCQNIEDCHICDDEDLQGEKCLNCKDEYELSFFRTECTYIY